MASLGHIAVGLSAGRLWAGARAGKTMRVFATLSLLPDIDVVGMALGVPYGAPWGHRGATHSLVMAALLGLAAPLVARRRGRRAVAMAFLVAAVVASHGLLDAMTDGGKGVALLWPFTMRRIFLPWRPIPVAPIGVGLLSVEGLEVMAWEAVAFLPLFVFAITRTASSEASPDEVPGGSHLPGRLEPTVDCAPPVPTPDEILANLLADEVRAHGAVRPPWVLLPGVHPFDIAWRMGVGETHLMLWGMWAQDLEPNTVAAAIGRHGAVPADWAWWAAAASSGSEVDDDLYELAFDDVRARLSAVGITVDGLPSED